MRYGRMTRAAAALLAILLLGGCEQAHGVDRARVVENADPATGKQLLATYGCGSCHIIPGIVQARALVGPPLIHWSGRRVIAGQVPNTLENLVNWITVPQSIEPGTDMPNLGVTDGEARHMAAYLYTLR